MIQSPARSNGWLLVVLLVATALAPLHAQPETEDVFEGHSEVVEVQIPINVVGRDGKPVRDLTVDDFVIYDEKIRQKITGFEVIDLSVVEPGGRREEIARVLPAVARRHFLLLFDLSFSQPGSIIRARESARDFVLESLHPTDLAAVATFSIDTGTRLLVTFTPDRAQLARAIDNIGESRFLDRADIDPLRFMVAARETNRVESTFSQDIRADSGKKVGNQQQEIQAYLDVIEVQLRRQETSYRAGRVAAWLTTLEALATKLASVEGRKHVVIFSEGFDGRLMFGRPPDGNDYVAKADQQSMIDGMYWMVNTDNIYGNSALQRDVLEMVQHFRRSDSMIQAVDISGLGSTTKDRRRARMSGQDSLFYVANETGGDLYEDANQFGDQLATVLERSSVTYLLTFTPSDIELDGSYHRLKIEADVPRGTHVRHRDGYFAPRPYEELHPMEKALLASDAIAAAAPKDDLRLDVLAASFRASEQMAYVPVIIEVDGRSLLFGHDAETMLVEFFTYVSDLRGEMKDFFSQTVTINLESGRDVLLETGIKYYGSLELAPGEYLVRVLVRNASTGRTGVVGTRVSVPAYDLLTPDLLPPFFFEQANKWIMVRENRRTSDDRTVIYPFTVNGEPYVPAARPVLGQGEKAAFCLVAYNLGGERLEIDGTVVGWDGEEVATGALELVERTVTGIDGLDKLIATFEPNGLEVGDYTLRVEVRQPESGLIEESVIDFTID